MDKDVLRLRAHLDQTRCQVRDALNEFANGDLTDIVKTCAKGQLHDLDERTALLVGMLAVIAIFDLKEGT